jgi:uncharacterized protein HemX
MVGRVLLPECLADIRASQVETTQGMQEGKSVTAGVGTHRRRPLKWLTGCLVTTLLGGVTASGQQTDQLQQQLQQLKQQYDATTHDLEQRIAALEHQIKEQQVKDENEAQQKAKENTV